MEDDEWTVVGGKRKGGKPAGCHGPKGGIMHEVVQHATGAPETGPDTGLGPSKVDGEAFSGHRPRGRARRQRTPEEHVAQLQEAVLDCRREIIDSKFYKHLLSVMSGASKHLPNTSSGAAGHCHADQDTEMQASTATHACNDASTASASASAHVSPSLASWSCIQQMVVYGLGSVEDSRVSKYQLGLALLLRDHLPALTSPPQLYDPAFSDIDVALLTKLGLQPLTVNEGGARAVQVPTLFYLPHCEGSLCDALLGANWTAEQLPHLVILGNRFSTYHDRWSTHTTSTKLTRPARLLACHETGVVEEVATPDYKFSAPSAFNDMSLHLFPAHRVQQHCMELFQ